MIPVSPPRQHPHEDTLAAYAAGTLPVAAALVVAAHLAQCPACRAGVGRFEAVGGALIEAAPLADLPADLFERTLARLDAEGSGPDSAHEPASRRARPAQADLGIRLPSALADAAVGPWRWSGPGLAIARVVPAGDDGRAKAMLMRIGAGRAMPWHGHTGQELTLVLQGAYSDAGGRFGPGDLADEDEDDDHRPMVEPGVDCVCLVAVTGRLRLAGIARLMQPFLGI